MNKDGMKKSVIITLIIGIIILTVLGIWVLEKRSQLISGFLGSPDNPLDINQDGLVNQSDLEQYTELYRQDDLRADFNGNGQVDYDDLIQYTSLYRSR